MIKIIEYTDEYREGVVDLLSEIILNEFQMSETKESISSYDYNTYRKNGGNLWLALDQDDKVIGTIAIENDMQKKEAKLVRVYLHPEYRGSGIATKLLNQAIDFVRGLNYNKIILGTYQKLGRAVKFYEKHGFKEYYSETFGDDMVKFYVLNI